MKRSLQYNAIRKVGDRIEEIRVRMAPDGFKDRTEEHVAWHDDPDAAKRSMAEANGVLP